MKRLSAVQQKQQTAVMAAVTQLETQAQQELAGFVQAWFSFDFENFPSSLLVRLQFAEQSALEAAQSQLLLWQKRLAALLVKKGILVKDLRGHLVMTCQSPDAD